MKRRSVLYILDNRVAEEATWDFQLLAKEVEFLHNEGIDLTTTGFAIPEIEMIFDAAAPPASNPEDDRIPDPTPHRIVTEPNDPGSDEHRLFCGDARRRESFAALLAGNAARLVFVDPPYNVKISGHVSGKGRIKHDEFEQASGEKTRHSSQNSWRSLSTCLPNTRQMVPSTTCARIGGILTRC